jgi:hypothetical protein
MAQAHHVRSFTARRHRKAAELHGKHDDKPDSNTPRRRTRSSLSP